MDAYEEHSTRRAALSILAVNPLARVYVPEAQDQMDVLRALSTAIFMECTEEKRAQEMAHDYEVLSCPAALIRRVAEAFAASRVHSWDEHGRKEAQAALGADVIRIVYQQIQEVAARQLEKEL